MKFNEFDTERGIVFSILALAELPQYLRGKEKGDRHSRACGAASACCALCRPAPLLACRLLETLGKILAPRHSFAARGRSYKPEEVVEDGPLEYGLATLLEP